VRQAVEFQAEFLVLAGLQSRRSDLIRLVAKLRDAARTFAVVTAEVADLLAQGPQRDGVSRERRSLIVQRGEAV
jgi:hypothetical protein